jgi:ribosome-binding protein aMBF1 (putative translation factor)
MNEDTRKDGPVILVIGPMTDLETICKLAGEGIRQHREQSGETREQFAERVGIELSLVEKIENGDVRTHQDLAFAFEELDNERIIRGPRLLQHGCGDTGEA